MAEMCKKGSAYWDARTGGFVGCLPPTAAPTVMRAPDGFTVIATEHRTAYEGIQDHCLARSAGKLEDAR